MGQTGLPALLLALLLALELPHYPSRGPLLMSLREPDGGAGRAKRPCMRASGSGGAARLSTCACAGGAAVWTCTAGGTVACTCSGGDSPTTSPFTAASPLQGCASASGAGGGSGALSCASSCTHTGGSGLRSLQPLPNCGDTGKPPRSPALSQTGERGAAPCAPTRSPSLSRRGDLASFMRGESGVPAREPARSPPAPSRRGDSGVPLSRPALARAPSSAPARSVVLSGCGDLAATSRSRGDRGVPAFDPARSPPPSRRGDLASFMRGDSGVPAREPARSDTPSRRGEGGTPLSLAPFSLPPFSLPPFSSLACRCDTATISLRGDGTPPAGSSCVADTTPRDSLGRSRSIAASDTLEGSAVAAAPGERPACALLLLLLRSFFRCAGRLPGAFPAGAPFVGSRAPHWRWWCRPLWEARFLAFCVCCGAESAGLDSVFGGARKRDEWRRAYWAKVGWRA
mmetsp:Transcript_756/g.1738  ORF Transcript_756/g.1738 Transcript_756/m.1738 type:complete len:457 (-) Transcript_756:503-1873(-)